MSIASRRMDRCHIPHVDCLRRDERDIARVLAVSNRMPTRQLHVGGEWARARPRRSVKSIFTSLASNCNKALVLFLCKLVRRRLVLGHQVLPFDVLRHEMRGVPQHSLHRWVMVILVHEGSNRLCVEAQLVLPCTLLIQKTGQTL